MGRKKAVNQEFFDEESKLMWYILGACYNCYLPYRLNGFKFTHSSKMLVEIVRTALSSSHSIIEDNRDKESYWIRIMGVPHLYGRLGELGLNVPKSERMPLERLEDPYVPHFTRGFLESRKRMESSYFASSANHLCIRYNHEFLVWFNQIVREYAGVQHEGPIDNLIKYGTQDTLRIYELCYCRDWEYTEKYGICLSSSRELPETIKKPNTPKPNTLRMHSRVATAMLLLDDYTLREASIILGYRSLISLYSAFKKATGLTARQWRELEPEERNLFMP